MELAQQLSKSDIFSIQVFYKTKQLMDEKKTNKEN